jgi:hypothetical protein
LDLESGRVLLEKQQMGQMAKWPDMARYGQMAKWPDVEARCRGKQSARRNRQHIIVGYVELCWPKIE